MTDPNPWSEKGFASALLGWFDAHGRRDLPWQREPTPYRVWVSEIMLQQTRVSVVVPYFTRFLARFPDLASLAAAAEDEVLHHWSGLGYYARARHLHRAARRILVDHGGQFPDRLEALAALPGIGRSTAGAILSLALGQRHPILDGNCKRVLSRAFAVAGWPGSPPVAAQLWELATRLTPQDRVGDFNQAMMDLGALCCTRHRPTCPTCPLAKGCIAWQTGRVADFPAPKPRRALPIRHTRLLLALTPAGELLLQRQPASGLWGGLWVPPELPPADQAADWCRQHLGAGVASITALPRRRHQFTHFGLDLLPLVAHLQAPPTLVADRPDRRWVDPQTPERLGLPAPVRRLLAEVAALAEPWQSGSPARKSP